MRAPERLALCRDLDLLVVATPPAVHLAHVGHALDCGVPRILCEKPMGISEAALQRFIETAPGTKEVFVNYQLRFDPVVQDLLTAAEWTGGDVSVVYSSAARHRRNAPQWYGDPLAGGGVLFAIGSHLIDLVHLLGRSFTDVKALPLRDHDDANCLDSVLITGSLQDGTAASLAIDGLATEAAFAVRVGNAGGGMWLDMIGGQWTVEPARYPLRGADGNATLSSLAPRPWRAAQQSFYRALAHGGGIHNAAAPTDAAAVHRVLAAAQASLALRACRPRHGASGSASSCPSLAPLEGAAGEG